MSRSRPSSAQLLGIDRSGDPDTATRRNAPWNPWTIPNAVTALRLFGIPVVLYLSARSDDGTGLLVGLLFCALALSDFLDGLLARLTGQYSRLGAVADATVDRLLVVAGIGMCWYWNLLPQWALGLVLIREAFVMQLSGRALAKGFEGIAVNWPGRLGVVGLMAAPAAALLGVSVFAQGALVWGLFFGWWAAIIYYLDGRRQLAERAQAAASPSA